MRAYGFEVRFFWGATAVSGSKLGHISYSPVKIFRALPERKGNTVEEEKTFGEHFVKHLDTEERLACQRFGVPRGGKSARDSIRTGFQRPTSVTRVCDMGTCRPIPPVCFCLFGSDVDRVSSPKHHKK